MRLALIELLVLMAIGALLLGLMLPGLLRTPVRGWGGWACLFASLGLLLYTVASVLARLLVGVAEWVFRER